MLTGDYILMKYDGLRNANVHILSEFKSAIAFSGMETKLKLQHLKIAILRTGNIISPPSKSLH